jgi:hypothetical protein
MKLSLYSKIVFLILFMIVIMTGLWGIDIGASAMIVGSDVIGLLGIRSGNVQYHLGLGLVLMTFLIQTLWLLYYIVKDTKRQDL